MKQNGDKLSNANRLKYRYDFNIGIYLRSKNDIRYWQKVMVSNINNVIINGIITETYSLS